jgi:hypothetical protein
MIIGIMSTMSESATIQLCNEDRHPSKGDTIKYIYTESRHKNPLCRVASIDSTNIGTREIGLRQRKI